MLFHFVLGEMKHCIELKTKSCPLCTFGKIKGATWKKHTSNKGKSKHIPFVLHSMGYTRIVLPAKPSSRANKRNNGARKRETKLIHIYIYIRMPVSIDTEPLLDRPSAWTGLKRGPTHDSVCKRPRKQPDKRETDGGRRGMDG